jgi:hypothetical protein
MLLYSCQTDEYCCHINTVARQLFKTGFFPIVLIVSYMNVFNSLCMSKNISAQNGKERLAVLISDTILLD